MQLIPDAAVSKITQSELERLEWIVERLKELKAESQALRASIIERYSRGAPIESGGLELRIMESVARHFTNSELVRILGQSETERLKRLLIPKVQTSVRVVRTQ
jgi:hypothetical protein